MATKHENEPDAKADPSRRKSRGGASKTAKRARSTSLSRRLPGPTAILTDPLVKAALAGRPRDGASSPALRTWRTGAVAAMVLAGMTRDAIAEAIGIAKETVTRDLRIIREQWTAESQELIVQLRQQQRRRLAHLEELASGWMMACAAAKDYEGAAKILDRVLRLHELYGEIIGSRHKGSERQQVVQGINIYTHELEIRTSKDGEHGEKSLKRVSPPPAIAEVGAEPEAGDRSKAAGRSALPTPAVRRGSTSRQD